MASTKQELIEEATKLGLKVEKSATIANLKALIAEQDKTAEETETTEVTETEDVAIAKAGKRSAKAIREAEETTAKEERKADKAQDAEKPKVIQKKSRSKLERQGKGIRNSAKKIELGKAYGLEEAIDLAKSTSHVKFDATVELHVNLNVDPRHADQNIRDNLVLPAGSGKKVRVAVFTEDPKAALAAGADIAGNEDFLQQLEKGKMDFDILIANPSLMAKLGKYARVLGPRGLMPNPKSGTVTTDIVKAINESKAGRVEYRVDTNGIIHLGVGKVSFTKENLNENISAVMASIKSNKPSSVKSGYVKAIYLATSMGPSITVDISIFN
jgi:large subunit ribosomal protein L1